MKATIEDTWGDEARILDTARLSASDRKVDQDNLTDQDKRLLRELLYCNHGVPFETLYVRVRLEMPLAMARQLVKHRISSWSEESKRYRGGIGEFYIPVLEDYTVTVEGYEPFAVFTQAEIDEYVTRTMAMQAFRERWLNDAYVRIKSARDAGRLPPDPKNGRDPYKARAREGVRFAETVSEYTKVIWTLNARSLSNVFFLRLDEGAQLETRKLADELWQQFSERFPLLAGLMERQREALWQMHAALMADD